MRGSSFAVWCWSFRLSPEVFGGCCGSSRGEEGVLHPPLRRQLPGDLPHQGHGQALADVLQGLCLGPPLEVRREPFRDLK